MLRSALSFVKSDMRAYLHCSDKKPLSLQAAELVTLAKRQHYLPYHYFVLGLYHNNISDSVDKYLPAKIMAKYFRSINSRESLILVNDKLVFRKLLEAAGLPVIREIMHIDKGGTITDATGDELSADEALLVLNAHNREVFVKPTIGSFGAGAFVAKPTEFRSLIRTARGVLVQPRLRQHPVLEDIHPHSVNTIRIDTLSVGKSIINNAAVLRVGTNGSVVDNNGAGGIVIGINMETGRLRGSGRQQPKTSTAWHQQHPETGVVFEQITIPNWNLIRDTVLRAARALTPHGLIALGWDVAVVPDGLVLIEANCNWSSSAMQIGWGGLAETEVGRRARRYHGIPVRP